MKKLPIRRMRWLRKYDVVEIAKDVFGMMGIVLCLIKIVQVMFSQ